MNFIHLNDIPVILAIALGIAVPEILQGFERWKTITRLVILAAFCALSAFLAFTLQAHVDPGAAFTRAFLIAVTSRIILTMNHIAQDQKQVREAA